jgi:hypothetical protein
MPANVYRLNVYKPDDRRCIVSDKMHWTLNNEQHATAVSFINRSMHDSLCIARL